MEFWHHWSLNSVGCFTAFIFAILTHAKWVQWVDAWSRKDLSNCFNVHTICLHSFIGGTHIPHHPIPVFGRNEVNALLPVDQSHQHVQLHQISMPAVWLWSDKTADFLNNCARVDAVDDRHWRSCFFKYRVSSDALAVRGSRDSCV